MARARYRKPTDGDIAAALRRGLSVAQVKREIGGRPERIRGIRDKERVPVRVRGRSSRTIDTDALASELSDPQRAWRQVMREWRISYPRLQAVAAAHGLSPAPRDKQEDWDSSRYPHRPDGMSQEEVATALGMSIQRVQQIEAAALAKLRGMVA